MDRRTVLKAGAMALATAAAARGEAMQPDGTLLCDPTEIIPLWPGTAPGGAGLSLNARIVERAKETDFVHDRYVDNVGMPILTVFRPGKADGSAVVICPGGGYVRTVIDKEAFESARRVNAAGITAFVLRYRLPGEGWNNPDVPLQDAQRAMRLVRNYAPAYGLDPARIGVLGFSAGGHVAASLATRHAAKVYDPVDGADALDAKPAFAGLMYPVITMAGGAHTGSRKQLLGEHPAPEAVAKYSCEQNVTAAVPPVFLCYAGDDDAVPPLANGFAFAEALAGAKLPVELHAFTEGGHGFGIRGAAGKPCAAWPGLFLAWGAKGGWFRGEAL